MHDLNQIINGKGLSLIPQLYLNQIQFFLFRKGIELYLPEEKDDVTLNFINKIWQDNKFDLLLRQIWRVGAITGEVLLYVMPLDGGYKILIYPKNQFEPIYDEYFRLIGVDIKSSYKDIRGNQINKTIKILKEKIISITGSNLTTIENSYGFIPCVIIQNKPSQLERSKGEFDDLKMQIEESDWHLSQLHGNLEFFGGPIFYSSRTKAEMVEAGLVENRTNSISAEGGYRMPFADMGQKIRARRIFDGLEEGEQIGFATPTPIDTSMVEFVKNFQKEIICALGGTPDFDLIQNSMSLFDYQNRYFQAFLTGGEKAKIYIDNGILSLYKMIVKMGAVDHKLLNYEVNLSWRYLGDVFPDSVNNTLNKSIVSRNLLRLGVNLKDSLRYIFSEKTDAEIEELLKGGFAYELVAGVADIYAKSSQSDGNIELQKILENLAQMEASDNVRRE